MMRDGRSDTLTFRRRACASNAGRGRPEPSPAPSAVCWGLGLVVPSLIWQRPPPTPRPLPAEARTSGSGWGRGFALRLVLSGFSPRAQSFHENLTQHHGPRHWDTCHLRDVLFRCHFHNFGSKEQSVLDYPLPEVRARGQGLLLPGANMKHPPPAIQAFLVNID